VIANSLYLSKTQVLDGYQDGVSLSSGEIVSSTVSGNLVGIRATGSGIVKVWSSNICDNSTYNLIAGSKDIYARMNWWTV